MNILGLTFRFYSIKSHAMVLRLPANINNSHNSQDVAKTNL